MFLINIFKIFFNFSAISYEVACHALNQKTGGFLHIHGNVKGSDWSIWSNETKLEIQKILGPEWTIQQTHIELVKSFAPRVYHLVLDLKCIPRISE